jgi:tetratricopeptide (TPR) repeat protein
MNNDSMNFAQIIKGSLASTVMNLFLFFPITATPLFSNLPESEGNLESSSITGSWRIYDFNGDGKFDREDINEIIDRGGLNIDFDLNHDGKKDMDDALALYLKLSVLDRTCNGIVDDKDYEQVYPVSLPEAPDIKTVRKLVSDNVSHARINLPFDIEDQAFRSVNPGMVLSLAEKAYVYQIAGLSGLAQRNLDAAIWGFGRSFQTDERSSGAVGSLGFCLSADDNDNDALLLLAYARHLFSESAATATSIGWIFARHDQNDEALEYFREAVFYTPEIAQYHMNLGILLMRMGKESEAFEEFSTAVELDPSDAGKFLFWHSAKPPDEPPGEKSFDPEEFKKERDAEINDMQELGYEEEELPVPWDQMSPCDQALALPEILDRKYGRQMDEIAQAYANDAAKKIESVIKGYWPEWKNFTEDWNRYVEGVDVVFNSSQMIMKSAETRAGNERASLTRQMGSELLGYSSFFMESAIKQASAEANEGVKRFSSLPLSAQAMTDLRAQTYKDALENAIRDCYQTPVNQALRWITAKSSPYGLPKADIETLGTQDFFMLFMVIPQRCFEIKGYCPDGEGTDTGKPDLPFDNTIGIDLFIVSIEWNPDTDEFELNVGQGIMVGMTWNPETGFGFQLGLGVHGSVGAAGGEMAVYGKIDEGKLTIESNIEGSIGWGPLSAGGEIAVTQAVFDLYNSEIFDW